MLHLRAILIFALSINCFMAPAALAEQTKSLFEAETTADDPFVRCIDASDGKDSKTKKCQAAEYDRVERRMNERISAIRAGLTLDEQKKLEKSQAKWWKKIEKSCSDEWLNFSDGAAPGTLDELSYDFCIIHEISYRANSLDQYYFRRCEATPPAPPPTP